MELSLLLIMIGIILAVLVDYGIGLPASWSVSSF
jgi:hypothetical protein